MTVNGYSTASSSSLCRIPALACGGTRTFQGCWWLAAKQRNLSSIWIANLGQARIFDLTSCKTVLYQGFCGLQNHASEQLEKMYM